MRKHFLFLSLALLLFGQLSWAVDASYYTSYINNKSGSDLFTGVHNVAKVGYSSLTYDGLWTAYCAIDINASGKVWDMYSNTTSYTCGGSAQGANYKKEGDSYNREHSIPKSWFGGTESKNTPGTDLFHVVPTDGYVNNMRSAYAFGEVSSATYTSNSGCMKGAPKAISISNSILGDAAVSKSCSASTVFEPMNEYKGDFARGYFGTMLKWANGDYVTFTTDEGAQIFNTAYDASHFYGLTGYGVALLLKWHREDPVSQKEIDRNNGIQNQQGNRNPFIDYPILAEYIWGKYSGQTFAISNAVGSFDTSNFTPGVSDGDKNSTDPAITSPTGTIDLGSTNTTVSNTYDMEVKGINLTSGGSLQLSLSGSSYFSLATYSVSQDQALNGYNVTITYAPTTEGSHTATLTINGCGVSNHTVTLTGSCTAEHTITWISNELVQYTTAATGTVPPLPAKTPANCPSSRVFVGWTEQTNVSGTAPTGLFTTPTATINAPKTYYAVYADATTTGSGATGSVAITTSTSNIPTSYGTANTFTEYTLEGYKFKIQQMYLNSGKLQWRAAGNSSGTGTMYNTSTFPGKLSSIVLTYNSSDNNKNFTLKVGSSPNPTEGTSITPTSSGNVYTFDCSDQNVDYFVLTNGSGAGYLDQIVINYSGSSTTYSNYSLECTACTPVTPTASFGSPITSLEEGTTVTNIVTTASNGVVTYSSNNTSVATVDASTGEVTGVAAGTATITASIAATACYNATSASYTITVEAAPEYTVTFISNGATFFSQTGHAGDAISGLGTPSLTDCDGYTFEGWSTSQYVEDNTFSPAIITPTTIPAGGATYYAVYTKSVTEGGSGGGGSSTANVSMESLAAASGIVGNYEFSTAKNNGSTAPTYNTTGKDLRIYAKGSVTISSSTAMTGIVFNLSSQGKKRLAPITASTGTIATQASGDEIVTWTGSATSVTFTVGDNADYGSDGSTKAGQLCFLSVDITTGSGTGGTTTTYHTTAPNCSCEVTITITSADETKGTVEFVE